VKYWNIIAKDQIEKVSYALRTLLATYPTAPVILTGHSLGAATATLVLAYLFADAEVQLPKDRLFIYTYGQPRVGDSKFAAWYNDVCGGRHFRVVHYNDIAPHIPCCKKFLTDGECRNSGDNVNPWHVMTEIYYTGDNMTTWKNCQGKPYGEDKSCSYSQRFYEFSIENHLTYFDAQVAEMCEILHRKSSTKATKATNSISYSSSPLITSIICVF